MTAGFHAAAMSSGRALARAYPWWPAWALAAAAWAGIALAAADGALPPALRDICRAGAVGAAPAPAGVAGVAGVTGVAGVASLAGWLWMSAAMMLPLQNRGAEHVAFSQPAARRHAAIALFYAGSLLPWLVPGLLVEALRPLVDAGQQPLNVAAGFIAAALWVLAPARARARAACHRTVPLRLTGWRMDAFRYGALMGWACVRTCWPAMVALGLTTYGAVPMALVTAALLWERYRLPHTSRRLAVALAALAAAELLRAWI